MKETIILPNHPALDYMGRIDFTNPKQPTFTFANSQVRTCFSGTSLKMLLKNHQDYYKTCIGVVLDGKKPYKVEIKKNEETFALTLAEGLEPGQHEVTLYKTHDGAHCFDFMGLVLDEGEEVWAPEPKPRRKIECFGDSISVGCVVEANDYVGKEDPEHEGQYCNSWWSYIAMTARNLGAQLHNTSQGGVALFDETGYFNAPHTTGMLSMYHRVRYNPSYGHCTEWDFKGYIPQVVVIAIGQNDSHPVDYINTDLEKRETWKAAYKKWIQNLQKHYPKAHFILTTTLLCHDSGWDDAITEVCESLGDPKVHRYLYARNGKATPGHVRMIEAKEMADELTAYIEGLGEAIWED